jgi:hypothetical protein
MMIISFACVDAFSYEGYLLAKKRYGSIVYIVKDAMRILFT